MRYTLILSLLLTACAGSELLDVPIETDDNARGVSFYKPDDWDPYPYDQYVANGGSHMRLPVMIKQLGQDSDNEEIWVAITNFTNKALCVPKLSTIFPQFGNENGALAWPVREVVRNDLTYFVDESILDNYAYRPETVKAATTRIRPGYSLKVRLFGAYLGRRHPPGEYMAYFHIFAPYCNDLRHARMVYEFPDLILGGAQYHILHPEKKWKVPPIKYIKHVDGDHVTPFNTPGILFTTRYPIRIEGKD